MNINEIHLWQLVTTGMQITSTVRRVEVIDYDEEAAFLVPIDGGHGGWHSVGVIYPARKTLAELDDVIDQIIDNNPDFADKLQVIINQGGIK